MTDRPDLQPPILWELADLATPMAVRAAATFSVADHIVAGRTTAESIAQAAGAHAGALDRVLRHLVTIGLLSRDAGNYALTESGSQLRSDHPGNFRALLDLEGAIGRSDLCFAELAHVVRTGEPAYPVRFGVSFWDDIAGDDSLSASFDALMGRNVSRDADKIARGYDWSGLTHLVDVGGGNGTLLSAILKAHPTLRGTVFDLPDPVQRARETLRDNGLADRANVVAGSFFDTLPSGAGGYLLSSILHDWDHESAVTILKRCAEAAGERGKVFIIEETGHDGESPSTEMDLRMLVYYVGRERGLAENIELAQAAGLTLVQVHQVDARSVIELHAAPAAAGGGA